MTVRAWLFELDSVPAGTEWRMPIIRTLSRQGGLDGHEGAASVPISSFPSEQAGGDDEHDRRPRREADHLGPLR